MQEHPIRVDLARQADRLKAAGDGGRNGGHRLRLQPAQGPTAAQSRNQNETAVCAALHELAPGGRVPFPAGGNWRLGVRQPHHAL